MFVLVVVEENEDINEPPPIIRPVREEFKNMVRDEIALGLPPMRDIHHINLILSFILLNKSAYKMSLNKHEELKRQVDKLLERGLSLLFQHR